MKISSGDGSIESETEDKVQLVSQTQSRLAVALEKVSSNFTIFTQVQRIKPIIATINKLDYLLISHKLLSTVTFN